MPDLSDQMLDHAKYLEELLEANKEALGLHEKGVFYGDQERIPFTPTACIEPGEKRRELNGAPRRTAVTIVTYIIIYHYQVSSTEAIREANDNIAEKVEAKVHENAQMGGLAIDSLVTLVESGYQQKARSIFRASRLTVESRSQKQLPSSV